MKRFFAVALLLISTPAFALAPSLGEEIASVTIEAPDAYLTEDETAYIGVDECLKYLDDDVQITARYVPNYDPAVTNLADGYYYFETTRNATGQIDCADGLCTEIEEVDITESAEEIVVQLGFVDLLGAGKESCEGFDNEYFIRIDTRDAAGDDTIESSDAKLIVDGVRPSAPSGLTATATESRIEVSFTGAADSDIDKYYVFYSTTAFADGDIDPTSASRTPLSDLSTEGSVSISLDSGETYYIAVASRDEAGNFSPLSNVVTTAAQETQDFWEAYRGAGGEESGGCSSTDGNLSIWALLLLLAFFVTRSSVRRIATRWGAMTAFVSVLLLATQASAETPTYGAFELKLGGYYPAIDSEFGGTGPYESVFGADNTVMGEFEIDGYFWQKYVKIGLAAHIGFAAHKGDALAENSDAEVSDTTRITFMPLRGSVVLRADYLAQHFGIPLVPSAKIGVDLYRWRIADGNGDTAEVGSDSGSGWKSGWHAAFGLHLLLDFFAPSMASGMDLHFGVNNSYFFAEYLTTKIDGFGGDGFDLSDNQWMFGLSFEF